MGVSTAPYVIPQASVVSSNLAAYGYDAHRQVLAVTFKSGEIWHYGSVSADLAEQFAEAESKGKFFVAHIRGKFPGEKMTGPCPKCGDRGHVGRRCEDCGCAEYAREERRG